MIFVHGPCNKGKPLTCIRWNNGTSKIYKKQRNIPNAQLLKHAYFTKVLTLKNMKCTKGCISEAFQ